MRGKPKIYPAKPTKGFTFRLKSCFAGWTDAYFSGLLLSGVFALASVFAHFHGVSTVAMLAGILPDDVSNRALSSGRSTAIAIRLLLSLLSSSRLASVLLCFSCCVALRRFDR
jgi:hypothetical protein